jgi:hypothetical protein
MAQYPPQTNPMPEQNKQPEIKAGAPMTDAEKKAQADKAQAQDNSNEKS